MRQIKSLALMVRLIPITNLKSSKMGVFEDTLSGREVPLLRIFQPPLLGKKVIVSRPQSAPARHQRSYIKYLWSEQATQFTLKAPCICRGSSERRGAALLVWWVCPGRIGMTCVPGEICFPGQGVFPSRRAAWKKEGSSRV